MAIKVCVRTVGCRTNQADSLALEEACARRGACIVSGEEEADVVIVNSCAVTSRAGRDVRRLVRRARRLSPGAEVIVTGCLVEVEPRDLWERLGASRVVPCADKMAAADAVVRSAVAGRGRSPATARPALKVQEGCAVGCAYCIVPATRGPERSVPAAEAIARARRLAGSGAGEVVLTGTQLGAWGRDLLPAACLADLVRAMLSARAAPRLRLSSVEPWSVDAALVDLFSAAPRGLARHLHVPLQSASPALLAAMGRPGGVEAWSAVAAALRPPVCLGTDVLVGLPGETEADFDGTLALVEGAGCAYLHVFAFSPRPGTRAACMAGRPDEGTVRRRVGALREASRVLRSAFLARLVGSAVEVVVEGRARGGVVGTSSEYARVLVEGGGADLVSRIVTARALRVEGDGLVARLEEVVEWA